MQHLFRAQPSCLWCGKAVELPTGARPILSRDWGAGTPQVHAYAACGGCRSLVLLHPPVAEQLAAYYRPDYAPYQPPGPELQRPLELPGLQALEALDRSGGPVRALDYGPGSGWWLAQVAARFQRAELHAVDFDPPGSQERLAWMGRPVAIAAPEAFLKGQQRWHLLHFSHSLEHLSNPLEVLHHGLSGLEPGGLVVIHGPSVDSLSLRCWGGFWQGLEAPRHLSIPAASQVASLLERAGLQIVQRTTYGGRQLLRQTLAAALAHSQGRRRWFTHLKATLARAGSAIPLSGRLMGRLGLGTAFMIVAQKPLVEPNGRR